MDYSTVFSISNGIQINNLKCFALEDILDNGQAFRWSLLEDGSFYGVAFGKEITLSQQEDTVIIHGATLDDFEHIWKDYFDLTRRYEEITTLFSSNGVLKKAMTFAPGLRVLHQDPWEALATFILSQNNNIKRIKGLVQRFCEQFGDPVGGSFAFPTPESIASLTVDDLAPVRAGFRSKYLVDAAKKVVSGDVSLSTPYTLPLEEARVHLMQIHGVGPKVADCTLLFGFQRLEVIPMDVWMKRAMAHFYPKGLPKKFQSYGGIAQQYLFHYTRLSPDALPDV